MEERTSRLHHVDSHLDRLLRSREFPKTICPSEVARALSTSELEANDVQSWRELMTPIRQYAFQLRDQGKLEILQKGNILPNDQSLEDTTGPIRLRKVAWVQNIQAWSWFEAFTCASRIPVYPTRKLSCPMLSTSKIFQSHFLGQAQSSYFRAHQSFLCHFTDPFDWL